MKIFKLNLAAMIGSVGRLVDTYASYKARLDTKGWYDQAKDDAGWLQGQGLDMADTLFRELND